MVGTTGSVARGGTSVAGAGVDASTIDAGWNAGTCAAVSSISCAANDGCEAASMGSSSDSTDSVTEPWIGTEDRSISDSCALDGALSVPSPPRSFILDAIVSSGKFETFASAARAISTSRSMFVLHSNTNWGAQTRSYQNATWSPRRCRSAKWMYAHPSPGESRLPASPVWERDGTRK